MQRIFIYLFFLLISGVVYPAEHFKETCHALKIDTVKDASEFGVVYDSKEDQHSAIQQAINTCSLNKWKLKISGIVTVKSFLNISSDVYIYSDNNSGFNYTGKTQYCFVSVEGAKNITLKGLSSFHKQNDAFCFFKCYRSSNVLLEDCSTNMTLIHVKGKRDDDLYNEADFNKSKNIIIRNCNGNGTFIKDTLAILIEYSTGVLIEGNTLINYRHGIVWWGGDSNPDKDGMPQNKRKCKNIVVSGNTVKNAEGGIWGSMGQHITVNDNVVDNCTDVGVDFEGCYDSKAINNRVTDAKNGNLAAFFMNRNISFINNTVSSSRTDTYAVVKIYNSSLNADVNKSIVFKGNVITCNNNNAGYFYVEPCSFLTINKNIFNNVCIKTIGYNQGSFLIKDNKFETVLPLEIPYFIQIDSVYNNRLISIKRNSFFKPASGQVNAIGITTDDFETENYVTIRNNRFNGFDNNKRGIYIERNITDKEIPKMFIDFSGNTKEIRLEIEEKRQQPK